jgi:hypothetical protein
MNRPETIEETPHHGSLGARQLENVCSKLPSAAPLSILSEPSPVPGVAPSGAR